MEHKDDLILYAWKFHQAVNDHLHQDSQAPQNPWGSGAWNIRHHLKQKTGTNE